jgi:PAS domain S-box-containing protein
MTTQPVGSADKVHVRTIAETRLKERSAPPTAGWPLGIDTLALLHNLASTPDRAADALKVLHELQVHQVELDLLKAELDATQRIVVEDLARYKAAYDLGPVGCFTVWPTGEIIEANSAGLRALGVERDGIEGRSVASFVAPSSQPAVEALLGTLRDGDEEASCQAQSLDVEGVSKPLRINARKLPGGQAVLIAVYD